MENIHKIIGKRILKYQGKKALEKIEKLSIKDGLFLDVFHSGVTVNISKIACKLKEIGIRESKKALKNL